MNPMQMNPMQMIQMMQGGSNPEALINSMFGDLINKNPMLTNMMNLAKNNDVEGVKNVARNLFQSQGRNFDEEFNAFRNNNRG